MPRTPAHPVDVTRVRAAEGARPDTDSLVTEEPLEIRANGRRIAVTMRTPGDDADLVRGFLVSEGLVRDPAAILRVRTIENPLDPAQGNIVNVEVAEDALVLDGWERHMYAASSCGVCGKASLEALRIVHPPLPSDDLTLAREVAYALPEKLRDAQALFEKTGGLHATGLFTRDGELTLLREDVGRHNAMDKVIGATISGDTFPRPQGVLLVSGRAGFEIVAKTVALRAPILLAVGAPSSLAVEVAQENRITLAGFLRGESMNVYTHPERIL